MRFLNKCQYQILAALSLSLSLSGATTLRQHGDLLHRNTGTTSCLDFVKYVPSRWEKRWLTEAPERQLDICGLLKREVELGRKWMKDLSSDTLTHLDEEVWSSYQYRNTCATDTQVLHFPIEPAVGLLRNPFAQPCQLESSRLHVEDRSYLMLAPQALTASFPGRKLLLDLGSGKAFDSSLAWFVESYRSRGVIFDEIWAWEVQETAPHEYWQQVPDSFVGKLHFYNTYASDKSGLPSPLSILKSKYSPGDFVVLKLDIDNEELESKIMEQVYDMPTMIGEIFFEKHFDAPEMRPYFGGGLSTTLADTLAMFGKFRKSGLRLHYWP